MSQSSTISFDSTTCSNLAYTELNKTLTAKKVTNQSWLFSLTCIIYKSMKNYILSTKSFIDLYLAPVFCCRATFVRENQSSLLLHVSNNVRLSECQVVLLTTLSRLIRGNRSVCHNVGPHLIVLTVYYGCVGVMFGPSTRVLLDTYSKVRVTLQYC